MIKNSRPRIALLGMGTLGGEPLGQGIPVIRDLFDRLSNDFDVVFYSFKSVDKTQIPTTICVRQTISWRFIPGRIKFFLIPILFAVDHIFNPCDVIFSVSIYPTGKWSIALGKLFRIPVIVQIIAFEAVTESNLVQGDLTKPWLKTITKKVCERANAVVAVAEYQKKIAEKNLPTVKNMTVLPLRINPKMFPYYERVITFPVQFLHIGYYGLVKDQDTMFRAFAKVAQVFDCHLTVIGNGYNTPKLHFLLNDLKIADRVKLVGLIKQSDLPKYYRDAHLLLHTARYETGCAVIQEAMASGVAVCGTEVGILSDIGDRYAAIVPVGDSDTLAKKILHLIRNPSFYQEMREEAHQWIVTYDAQWSADLYRDFIKGIIK
jgi:glycosyltransferase involved in cell wall biosynthesis